eukprot:scaffold274_cov384-Prasinococcus_capsulatus_cf.AAC.1
MSSDTDRGSATSPTSTSSVSLGRLHTCPDVARGGGAGAGVAPRHSMQLATNLQPQLATRLRTIGALSRATQQ